MTPTKLQQAIKTNMPVLCYMRAQALVVHLCHELEIIEECFSAQWIMLPQADLDRILIRLGYAWIEYRRLYIAHQPVSSAAHVRLSSTLPEWFREGVLIARRMAKHHPITD